MRKKQVERLWDQYLTATVLCLFFSGIYEFFSHNVYSPWMVFAFAVPLLGGTGPCTLLHFTGKEIRSGWWLWLWNSGLAVLTAGFLFRGILEIYGTTNPLESVYWLTGAAFLLLGCVMGARKK